MLPPWVAPSLRRAGSRMRWYHGQQQQVVPFMEPLHILGGGSIGLLFAASMRSAFPSYPLTLLLRDRHRAKIDDDDHKIMACLLQGGRPRMVAVPAQIIGDPSRRRPIQNLLVTTKAYAAKEAVRSVLHQLPQEGDVSIVLLCNGAFAVKDELLPLMAEQNSTTKVQLILATTTHGAYQEKGDDDMYRVVHAGQGLTFVEDHPTLSQLWDQSGLCSTSISNQDMTILLWQKLATNCAINPLTALHNCENGQLLSLPSNNNLPSVEQVLQEVSTVATTALPNSNQLLDYESLRSFVFQVIEDTHRNRSSMLQDVTNRQRTEVEYLNGYVVDKGKAFGIDTPANQTLCTRIQELSGFA